MAAGCLDRHWLAHRNRRAELWRTGGHDAKRWWPVCLSARSLFAHVGLSLRVDALPRNSNRDDRGSRGWIRALFGRPGSVSGRRQVSDRSETCLWQLCDFPFDGPVSWRAFDCSVDVHEHAWVATRQAGPEYFHNREARGVIWSDSAGNFCRLELWSRPCELRQSVDCSRIARRPGRRADGGHCIWLVRRSLRGPNRLAVLGRCVEQHHLHRRRSQGSQTQHSLVTGVWDDNRYYAVFAC